MTELGNDRIHEHSHGGVKNAIASVEVLWMDSLAFVVVAGGDDLPAGRTVHYEVSSGVGKNRQDKCMQSGRSRCLNLMQRDFVASLDESHHLLLYHSKEGVHLHSWEAHWMEEDEPLADHKDDGKDYQVQLGYLQIPHC